MRIDPPVLELLEFGKSLAPVRERLRGPLGELALGALGPAADFNQLQGRAALLREWIDLCDHEGEVQWNAGVAAVTNLSTTASHTINAKVCFAGNIPAGRNGFVRLLRPVTEAGDDQRCHGKDHDDQREHQQDHRNRVVGFDS